MSRHSGSRGRQSAGSSHASGGSGGSLSEEEFELIDRNVGSTPQPQVQAQLSPEEQAKYEQQLDDAHKAQLIGLELPPVAPPGFVMQPVVEKPKITFWTLLFKRAENRNALYQLYVTTALMVILPFGLMFLSYSTLFSGMDSDSRLMWSGFAGVLGVNVVTIGFGLFAYWEPSDEEEQEEEASAAEKAKAEEEKRKKWEAWEAEQEKEESLENKARLAALREKHKQQRAEESGEAASDSPSSTPSARVTRSRSRARSAASRDSALEQEEQAPAAAAQLSSRATRTRSQKM